MADQARGSWLQQAVRWIVQAIGLGRKEREPEAPPIQSPQPQAPEPQAPPPQAATPPSPAPAPPPEAPLVDAVQQAQAVERPPDTVRPERPAALEVQLAAIRQELRTRQEMLSAPEPARPRDVEADPDAQHPAVTIRTARRDAVLASRKLAQQRRAGQEPVLTQAELAALQQAAERVEMPPLRDPGFPDHVVTQTPSGGQSPLPSPPGGDSAALPPEPTPSGGQSPLPSPPGGDSAALPPEPEPRRSWKEHYRASRAGGAGILGSAYEATRQRVREAVQPHAQGTGQHQAPLERALDNARQVDQWNTAPGQHVLQAAAQRHLDQDTAARQQAADEVRRMQDRAPDAPQVSDRDREAVLGSQDPAAEWYARSRLGYRPGDPRARDPERRRDQSDQEARWEDVLPGYDPKAPSQEHRDAIERWSERRQRMDTTDFLPANDRERDLHSAYQRTQAGGRSPGAADLAMWNQRLDAGAPATSREWAEQFPQAQIVNSAQSQKSRSRRSQDDDDENDDKGKGIDRTVARLEYARYAGTRLGQAAVAGAAPALGQGAAGVASDAMQSAGALAAGLGGMAAGAITGNPAALIKGLVDTGEAVVGLPGKLVEWGDALVESKDAIKMFSADLANASAMAELRTFRRGAVSAQATGAATARLSEASQSLKDEMQPLQDTAHNFLANALTKGLRDLGEITRMIREYGQSKGWIDSDRELAAAQMPFQQLMKGLQAGGFKTMDGKVYDIQGAGNRAGMHGVPEGAALGGQAVGQETGGEEVAGRTQDKQPWDIGGAWNQQDVREEANHKANMEALNKAADDAHAALMADPNNPTLESARSAANKAVQDAETKWQEYVKNRTARRQNVMQGMANQAAAQGQDAARKQQEIQGRDRGNLPDSPVGRMPVVGEAPRERMPIVAAPVKEEPDTGPNLILKGIKESLDSGAFGVGGKYIAGRWSRENWFGGRADATETPPPNQRAPRQ